MNNEKSGVVLVRPADNGFKLLMVKNRHSIGWSYFLEDHAPLDVCFSNMFSNELWYIQSLTIPEFEQFSYAYKEKYPFVTLRIENLHHFGCDMDAFLEEIKPLALSHLHDCRQSRFTFPKGTIEEGESAKDAAIRELYEETGIRLDEDLLIPEHSLVVSNKYARVRFWIVFIHDDREDEINTGSEEISHVQWVAYNKQLFNSLSCWYRCLLTNIRHHIANVLTLPINKGTKYVPTMRTRLMSSL